MIVHDKDYIKKQKTLSLIITILSLLIMLFFYIFYRIYSKKVYLLVLAALCAIPAAQFCTRFILFLPHKDCKASIIDDLLKLPSSCFIINTALFTDGKHNGFIDSIVITGNKILCIVDKDNKYSLDAVKYLKDILNTKGINYSLKQIDLKDYSFEKIKKLVPNQESNTELLRIIKSYLI